MTGRDGMIGDLERGWHAPPGPLMTGALVALAVTGVLAVAMAILTALPGGLIALASGIVQLGLAYSVAGRLVRQAEERENGR